MLCLPGMLGNISLREAKFSHTWRSGLPNSTRMSSLGVSLPPTPGELKVMDSSVWSESVHGFWRTLVSPNWQCCLFDLFTFLVLIYFPDLQATLQITLVPIFLTDFLHPFLNILVLQKFLSLQQAFLSAQNHTSWPGNSSFILCRR